MELFDFAASVDLIVPVVSLTELVGPTELAAVDSADFADSKYFAGFVAHLKGSAGLVTTDLAAAVCRIEPDSVG